MSFVELYYIKSQFNGLVLDIENGSTDDNARVVVWDQKFDECEGQLWRLDDGYIINFKSGRVLDISGGNIDNNKDIIQYSRKRIQDAANQRWVIDDEGYIGCSVRPDLVLDIGGCNDGLGAKIILYEKRRDAVAYNQRWTLERY
ncbi:ricin B lectin domain-containing protein [Pilobolus umbonatus]|nr:ricin B lectin domain-containing protein [Pilobolus umbonatus]